MSDHRPPRDASRDLYRRSGARKAPPPAAAPRESEGTVKEVTSLANPVVKELRALHMKKERAESGLFLAEGLKLVTDALEEGWPIRTLVHAARVKDQPLVKRAVATAKARGALVLETSDEVLTKICRRDNPQMVVAAFEQKIGRLADLTNPTGVWVALEGVKDPGNLGTIVRTVDSVGASGVILLGDTTDPFALEAVRATMGSLFHVPLYAASLEDFVAWKRATGIGVWGTHLKGAVDYRSVDWPETCVLMMGNEQSGISDAHVAACDGIVKIPMAGRADSLNLAVATAVTLYEIRRSRLTV
ncbi:TrmH family RNA methyltransferase [Pinisolibacter aquiterrae]|uniref:TrmH family RNA methyltransferase n=1 Tax=Pinisolibacter aquiterrae TaxID=2815579 RepID=UPI001C3D42CE|nr:RNA methyltransferase [Pinisolibacter aquiterrae]MBV5266870.1 RNA methyltransferase [Pinisolibacter aquiterrae]MCC8234817.1 RNA methyltransferase [Pinisolibacter aquiterrae]